MKTVLTVDSLRDYVGTTVQDPYGRIIGTLVSVESEVDGTVVSIAVQAEDKTIRFFAAKAVRVEDGKVVVWPEWKVLASETIMSYQTALRRLRSLEELRRKNEVSDTVFAEFKKRLDASLNRLREQVKKLRTMIKERLNELEDESLRVERAITGLKMSYLAGEIPDSAYKSAINALRSVQETINREKEDIKATLARLDAVEKGVETQQKTQRAEKTQPTPTAVTAAQQPLTVKIINE